MKQTINWEAVTSLEVNNDIDTLTCYNDTDPSYPCINSQTKIVEFSLYNGEEDYEGDCLLISKTTDEKFNLWFIHKERLPIVVVRQVGFEKLLFKKQVIEDFSLGAIDGFRYVFERSI